ncbi:hypothetical protein SEPCBS119000_001775 [Sporothrix epigloea]|uniref:Gag1-like clamp domain-containing protein n=1 Tax=Sporothrix epigloea TaxID=1892477 RepID=A0ABP0DCK4_9PEZI
MLAADTTIEAAIDPGEASSQGTVTVAIMDATDGEAPSRGNALAESSAGVVPPPVHDLVHNARPESSELHPPAQAPTPTFASEAGQNSALQSRQSPAQASVSQSKPVAVAVAVTAADAPESDIQEPPLTRSLTNVQPAPFDSCSHSASLDSGSRPAPLPAQYDFDTEPEAATAPKMGFSNLYKSPKFPLAKFRSHHSNNQQQSTQADAKASDELVDYGDPDLLSRDKSKQKDAVRRYLFKRIRNDWSFTWPAAELCPIAIEEAKARAQAIRQQIVSVEQAGLHGPFGTFASPLPQPAGDATISLAAVSMAVAADAATEATLGSTTPADELDSDAHSLYSTVSEDTSCLRPRAEWVSDISEDENIGIYYQKMPSYVHSTFRYESPDAVGAAIHVPADVRKAKARRNMRAEMAWNEGLACFAARRDAWTGARTVHVKHPKPAAPTSPTSPLRGLFRLHSFTKSEPAPAPSKSVHGAGALATDAKSGGRESAPADTVASTPVTSDYGSGADLAVIQHQKSVPRTSQPQQQDCDVETMVPVVQPLLPPGNPMRASITPAMYLNLYDKLVLQCLRPSCPVNLSDMIGSCVAGWKRDNEWLPPRPVAPPPPIMSVMSVSLRKKRHNDRRDSQKEKRGTHHSAADGGKGVPSSPGLGRRMSTFLSSRPAAASIGLPSTTTASTSSGAVSSSPPADEKDGDSSGGSRGLRRSLQRVLGLGQATSHGSNTIIGTQTGGHGHSVSAGAVSHSLKTN